MGEEQKEILKMLAEGKISIEEAERLLTALDTGKQRRQAESEEPRKQQKQQTVHEALNSVREVVAGIGPLVGRLVGEISTEIQKDRNFPGETDAEELPALEVHDGGFPIDAGTRLYIRCDKDGGPGTGDLTVESISGDICRLEADEARNLRVLRSSSGPVIRWAGGPIKVLVPHTVSELFAYTLNGDLALGRVECPVRLKSMGGDMVLGGPVHRCYAKALGGQIKLTLGPDSREPTELKTMGGDVQVAVLAGTPTTDVEAVTIGGSIVVEDTLGEVKKGVNLGRQKVQVCLGEGQPTASLKIKTMGGNIEIRRAGDE